MRSLEEALINFRSSRPRTLWVDAICIDQDNDEERNHQVSKMQRIYSNAKLVLVWLGPTLQDSEFAFKLLHQLRNKLVNNNSAEKILGRKNQRCLVAIVDLFCRPYWSRVWVVQEVSCAQNVMVHCGADSISWSDLTMVQSVVAIEYERALENAAFGNAELSYLENAFLHFGPRKLKLSNMNKTMLPDLFGVLDAHLDRRSTDPRDHIYGIIGLTSARDNKRLQIDYSKSVCQLFTETSEYIISTSHELDVVCSRPPFASVHNSTPELPSWVADWASAFDTALMPRVFSAAGTTLAIASCDIDKGILRASGICIGRIKSCGARSNMSDIDDQNEALITFCDWHKLVRTECTGRFVGWDAKDRYLGWDAFMRILSFDDEKEPTDKSSEYLWTREAKELVRYCQKICPTAFDHNMLRCIPWSTTSRELSPTQGTRFVGHVTDVIYGRKFFTSQSRLMGLGPETLEADDFICVLFGCKFPVILRPIASHYLLLGPAYVDRYMWGKAISDMEIGAFDTQEFEIY
jgi:hypothetical protein